MNEIPKELLDRLDILAAKAGVTAEAMWGIWVKAAPIGFWTSVAVLLLAAALTLYSFKKYFWVVRRGSEEAEKAYSKEGEVPYIAGSIIGLIVIIVALIAVSTNFKYVLVPELYALEQFTKLLR